MNIDRPGPTPFAVVLYEPEIPPNTGNVARTCAATGTALHLIQPLGFSLEDRYLKRAGLDYWDDVRLSIHAGWDEFLAEARATGPSAVIPALLSTKGRRPYTEIPLPREDHTTYLVFGPETRGLSAALLADWSENTYRVPMKPGQRSLNLGNTVALVLYDQLARAGFPDML